MRSRLSRDKLQRLLNRIQMVAPKKIPIKISNGSKALVIFRSLIILTVIFAQIINRLSGIKNLAGQTMWYGLSSIAARFINYLLTPYLVTVLALSNYGKMSLVYAAIPLLNVIFTFGFETAYFRFSGKEDESKVYSTASISLFFSTVFLSVMLWFFRDSLAFFAGIPENPLLIQLSIAIIVLDTLTTLPFARLRYQGRPLKFAFIRISGILINIGTVIFFLTYCPKILKENPSHWIGLIYSTNVNPVVYVVVANVIQSAFALLLLSNEIGSMKISFSPRLWKQMMLYSLPLVVAGLGGMINETFDRILLKWWIPGDAIFKDEQVGIYSACYKLSILITLFIQAFRMGAEPFFFKQAEGINPQRVYARVMKFFVIAVSVMFLVVSLFLPVWKYFLPKEAYWVGLGVVPVLLLANIFLGIYYNLSIWYKLGNKTGVGAYITLIGAAITLLINWLLIPYFSYFASAWATLVCYGTMMVISFVWGQKHYPIPYARKKLLAYLAIVVILFLLHSGITHFITNLYFDLSIGAVFIMFYMWFIILVEKKEFQKLPVVGRYIR